MFRYVKINGSPKVYDLSNGEGDYKEHEDGTWSAEALLVDIESSDLKNAPVIIWAARKPKKVRE